jgi:hypothetical protein
MVSGKVSALHRKKVRKASWRKKIQTKQGKEACHYLKG